MTVTGRTIDSDGYNYFLPFLPVYQCAVQLNRPWACSNVKHRPWLKKGQKTLHYELQLLHHSN